MSDLGKRVNEMVERYKCTHPNPDPAHGCSDCSNQGYVFDSEEISIILEQLGCIKYLEVETEKLKKEIESLKSELAKERSVVDFYASRVSWITSHFSPDYVSEFKLKIVNDTWNESDAFYFGGKLARQRQRERDGGSC